MLLEAPFLFVDLVLTLHKLFFLFCDNRFSISPAWVVITASLFESKDVVQQALCETDHLSIMAVVSRLHFVEQRSCVIFSFLNKIFLITGVEILSIYDAAKLLQKLSSIIINFFLLLKFGFEFIYLCVEMLVCGHLFFMCLCFFLVFEFLVPFIGFYEIFLLCKLLGLLFL
jgi:hypothetical protein